MVIILRNNADEKQLNHLKSWMKDLHIEVHETIGKKQTILGLVGDTTVVDIQMLRALEIVEDVRRIQEPYKAANRKMHPEDTVVSVGDVKIGGGNFAIIAGPCSVESEEQICEIAASVKASGAWKRDSVLLRTVSSNTLGIYLIHDVLNRILLPCFHSAVPLRTVWGTLVYALVLLTVCTALCLLIRKIPVLRKLI